MISDDLRRVLQEGPQGEADYELACWLIERGYARGVCGKRLKGRENYGKLPPPVWLGMTPAGRLWLEESARTELDEAKVVADQERNQEAKHLTQEALESIAEAITGLPKPQSSPVKIAIGVLIGFLVVAAVYLFRTHLGITL